MKRNKLIAVLLIAILVWISFYKDEVTPDYLNSAPAAFLNPNAMHTTDENHSLFWAMAIGYSLLFVFLPFLIIRFWFDSKTAVLASGLLIGMLVLEYVLVFSGNATLIVHILPKINRYFHSPIVTLFFIALFTLNKKNEGPDRTTI